MGLKIADNFSLPLDFVTGTEAILGRKGSGKSHTASVMAEELLEAGQQVIVIDPTDSWWGLRAARDEAMEKGHNFHGYPVAVLGGEHADVPLEATQGKEVAHALASSRASAILSVGEFDSNAAACRFVADFLNELFRLKGKDGRPLKLIIDEADAFAPQRPQGEEMKALGAMQKIIRRGRSRGIGCLMITQRPQEMSKGCLSQADMLVLMRLSHPKDIAAVDEWVRVQADEKQADQVMNALPALPTGKGWLWHPGQGLLTSVQFRRRRTYDSGATPKANEVRAQPGTFEPINIAELGAAIAKAAAEQKANDPVVLREELARLGAELAEAKEKLDEAETTLDDEEAAHAETLEMLLARPDVEAAMLKANNEGVSAGREVERQSWMTLIEEIVEKLQERVPAIANEMLKAAMQQRGMNTGVSDVTVTPRGMVITLEQRPGKSEIITEYARRMEAAGEKVKVVRPEDVKPMRMIIDDPVERREIPKGESAVLICLAQHRHEGCSREQLSILCGYKRSTRDRYVQLLTQRGLCTGGDGRIWITPAGVAALGKNYKPLPTGRALREYWLQKLPQGEKAIFEHVIHAHTQGVSRDRLSELTGYKRSTRDRYIQLLQTRELIERGGGVVKAKAELFKG